VAVPVLAAPAVMVIQAPPLVAVHPQPLPAVTVPDPVPAWADSAAVVGDTLKVQDAPA
jgi:hypothetical protein